MITFWALFSVIILSPRRTGPDVGFVRLPPGQVKVLPGASCTPHLNTPAGIFRTIDVPGLELLFSQSEAAKNAAELSVIPSPTPPKSATRSFWIPTGAPHTPV